MDERPNKAAKMGADASGGASASGRTEIAKKEREELYKESYTTGCKPPEMCWAPKKPPQ